eukprot:3010170-Pleurochrysis_carterae.AAC.2
MATVLAEALPCAFACQRNEPCSDDCRDASLAVCCTPPCSRCPFPSPPSPLSPPALTSQPLLL